VSAVFADLEGFQWDKGNSDKNLIKHSVQNWECEQLFFNQPLLVLEDIEHSQTEKRWAAFGVTGLGRRLVIIFTERNKLLRVISARDMNSREKKYYEEHKEENP
jgi:uncharacterized DUF497 family protein